jgi:hypothetical protein
MSIRFLRETLMAVTVLSTATANGAEIVLEQSAVQKLVVESLFKDNGRYYIQRGACSAYLENPAVTLTGGRVVIRSHLNARLGMDFGDSCAGVDLASWTTVSGEPSAQGTTVRLANIRIDDVGDANTRIVLNSARSGRTGRLEVRPIDAPRRERSASSRSASTEYRVRPCRRQQALGTL